MIITQRGEAVEGADGGFQKHWMVLILGLIVSIILYTVWIYCIHPLYGLCFPVKKNSKDKHRSI